MNREVGFTGTEYGMTDIQKSVFVSLLDGLTLFRHGSCWGADVQAARIVRDLFSFGVHIVAHPGPVGDDSGIDDETLPPLPYLERNHVIVDLTGELIACPKGNNEVLRSGTWATIRYAHKIGRKVTIIFPGGHVKVNHE